MRVRSKSIVGEITYEVVYKMDGSPSTYRTNMGPNPRIAEGHARTILKEYDDVQSVDIQAVQVIREMSRR